MSTLSRVAESLYWMGRYVERAEGIARMLEVNAVWTQESHSGTQAAKDWATLLRVVGSEEAFGYVYKRAAERNVIDYMLLSPRNPSSVRSTIAAAREGARTIRDVLSREAWEQLNGLHLDLRDLKIADIAGKPIQPTTSMIRFACQQHVGVLEGTVSKNEGYYFVRLGRNLERADMTTRMLDVRADAQALSGQVDILDDARWRSLLRTMSAYQMYRLTMKHGVTGTEVVRFLLHDETFPRAVHHCLDRIVEALRVLPHNRELVKEVRTVVRGLQQHNRAATNPPKLHKYLDRLQIRIARVHDAITQTYFTA